MSGRSQAIATILTHAILDHRLISGAKLGERELSEIFNVSRIVIRQALIRLADDGLAVIELNRGAFVARPGPQDAIELYEAITLVEQGVAAQLIERVGPSGWQALRRHIEHQRQAHADGRDEVAETLGEEFHALFVRMSHNKVMQDIHAQLIRRTSMLRSLAAADCDYCDLIDEHSRLVDLLENGLLKEATDLIERHNRHVMRGYVVDHELHVELPLKEALEPYLSADGVKPHPISPRKPSGSAN